jgi:NAD(P)-dependent dehydrogenase (short-subunit alcohol dehydrogenase family)
MPHLRASRGRLVTVRSVGGVVGQPFNEACCAAKLAVEGFLEARAPVAASTGVRVGVVEPGAVASELVSNAGLDPQAMLAAAGPYATALGAHLTRVAAQFADVDGSAVQSLTTPWVTG